MGRSLGIALALVSCGALFGRAVGAPVPDGFPAFPAPAAPTTAEDLRARAARVLALARPVTPGSGGVLGEDWITQGDWIGRYGRRYTVLCATRAPLNHVIEMDQRFKVGCATGVSAGPPERVRRWVEWLRTEDHRVLYNPILGYRREAEWDDHGESRPLSVMGPDLWVSVHVPDGMYRLSLYFMNKDGHTDMNRYRDYIVELRLKEPGKAIQDTYGPGPPAMPVLARTRVQNFWSGVYKQFVVAGPADYYVKIDRNYSLNVILQSVMLDKLPTAEDLRNPMPLPWLCGIHYPPLDPSSVVTIESRGVPRPGAKPRRARPVKAAPVRDRPLADAATALWNAMDAASGSPDASHLDRENRVLAWRAGVVAGVPGPTLSMWRWQLCAWSDDDRSEFREVMANARDALLRSRAK